ncbi:hypothetical protein WJX72_009431 [[Myrmecia] bisecta]|uniref:Mini-chromosome maintenance complex-binding protein n=1 Tax=[Myrmecia] bisecta TaxID=41462 RepID=A0AAW1P8W9_9CHLO
MDSLKNPLQTVRDLFAKAGQPSAASSAEWGVEAHFRALLANPEIAAKIPSLNHVQPDAIPNRSLVCFRGMVQDMLDPEYYVGAFQRTDGSWQTTKYADVIDEEISTAPDKCAVWDRKPLYCVRVPGESAWCNARAESAVQQSADPAGQASTKRPREDDNDEAQDMSVSMQPDGKAEAGEEATSPDGEPASAKVQRTDSAAASQAATSGTRQVETCEGDCMIYVYDNDDKLRLNDVVDIIGVLSFTPELATLQMDVDHAEHAEPADRDPEDTRRVSFFEEEMAARPPTSLVPRLHAILVNKQTGPASSPALPIKDASQIASRGLELRQHALGLLGRALGGDMLAAEYVLLQLVSRVYNRQEDAVLGVLSLNLTGCPKVGSATTPSTTAATTAASANGSIKENSAAQANGGGGPGAEIAKAAAANAAAEAAAKNSPPAQLSPFGAALKAAIAALTPRCVALALDTNQLNKAPMYPRRDYTLNRMTRAPLQLADGTQLLLDETVLQPGTLTPTGVNNLKAIKALMDHKLVEYEFDYYTLPQPADAPATILSAGNCLFKHSVDVILPLHVTAELGDAAGIEAAAASLDLAPVRAYLGLVRNLDFHISDDVSAKVQAELVACRQKDRKAIGAETFHTWLTMARLLALSHGEATLSEQRWAQMRALEHTRQERLRVA